MRLPVAAALAAGLGLSACTHELILTPQDGIGPIGHGAAPAPIAANYGKMSVDLAGKHYDGQWTLQNAGGFLGAATSYSGAQVATGTMYGASTNGNGRAYLTETGGSSLSCDFSYSSWSGTGIGGCRRDDGKLYSLMIH